jgi:DNA-directed RNA polymerase specialized sigma24 family protein
LLLHFRDGLTYPQIARHVGLSISMVGRHLSLGLEACRQALNARPTENTERSHDP